jgi:precorrin-8X/cobalt-precorrin-8 methylmutase
VIASSSRKNMTQRALIHDLLENPMTGQAIEDRSFQVIDREAGDHGFTRAEWEVVRRLIHTTADFEVAAVTKFSPDAIDAGKAGLRSGRPIFTDSNMIRSGLSLARLRRVCPEYARESIFCHVADEDVAEQARNSGLPRSLYAVRKARAILEGGILVFGNAPVALMELNRLIIEEDVHPALVIAMPVGFVHVIESKEELMSLGVPFIAMEGRRGGSPPAVSVVHALCSLAERDR